MPLYVYKIKENTMSIGENSDFVLLVLVGSNRYTVRNKKFPLLFLFETIIRHSIGYFGEKCNKYQAAVVAIRYIRCEGIIQEALENLSTA